MSGQLFQTRDAFLNSADMVTEEDNRSDREVCVSWKNLNKVQRLLVVQYLESSCSNFKIDSLANR